MPVHYLIVLIIAVTLIYAFVSYKRKQKRIRELIRASFGKAPEKRSADKIESVSKYWNACAQTLKEYRSVDENTWYDLEMDLFLKPSIQLGVQ